MPWPMADLCNKASLQSTMSIFSWASSHEYGHHSSYSYFKECIACSRSEVNTREMKFMNTSVEANRHICLPFQGMLLLSA